MIPKTIHYCWFGRTKMPDIVLHCIESWKKHLPDYEFKEWNENNFCIDSNLFVKEAYKSKMYAFVSDYVRLYALYTEGGIYLDTDVEVLKTLNTFLDHIAFLGYEDNKSISTAVMGSESGAKWAYENLKYYDNRSFCLDDGKLDTTTNVTIMTKYMSSKGLSCNNKFQDFENFITVYPKDFFSPKSFVDRKLYLTVNTCTIHHFNASWHTMSDEIKLFFIRFLPDVLVDIIVRFKQFCRSICKHSN